MYIFGYADTVDWKEHYLLFEILHQLLTVKVRSSCSSYSRSFVFAFCRAFGRLRVHPNCSLHLTTHPLVMTLFQRECHRDNWKAL